MLKKPSEPLSHAKATPQLFLTKLHIILTFNKHILLNNVNPPGNFRHFVLHICSHRHNILIGISFK